MGAFRPKLLVSNSDAAPKPTSFVSQTERYVAEFGGSAFRKGNINTLFSDGSYTAGPSRCQTQTERHCRLTLATGFGSQAVWNRSTRRAGKRGVRGNRCCLSGIIFLQMLRTDPHSWSYPYQLTTSGRCPSDDERYPRSRYTNTRHEISADTFYFGVRKKYVCPVMNLAASLSK